MLQAIRERAQGIFAWVMLIAVGIPFALWGIQNYLDTGKETPAAVVGDHEIFDRDVNRAYDQSLNNLVGIGDTDEKALRQEALERLINEEVLYQHVERESLTSSDAEVRAFIQTLPYFQTDGKFDKEKYKVMLSSQGMSSDRFVAQLRRSLAGEQFQRSILDSEFVTQSELETLLRLKNQQRQFSYFSVPLKPSGHVFSDADVESYFRAHADQFRTPEKVSVDYVLVSLDEIAKSVSLTEEDVRKAYEDQKASFGTPEKRKISHILIPFDGKGEAAEKAALEKAQSTRDRLLKGEDFAKLAREVSQDAASAQKGGDLGYLNKEAFEETFYDAASRLKLAEVSEPVKTTFGYDLIKLTEWVPAKFKPFEEVKDELKKTAQHNAAEAKFYEVGQKLAEQAFENPDSLEGVASSLNLKVQHSGLFTRDAGDGVAKEESVRKAAFAEEVLNGRNSDPVELGNDKALVLRVRDHELAADKPMNEIKAQILNRLKIEDAWSSTEQQAEKLVQDLKSKGQPIAELAKSASYPLVSPGFIRSEAGGALPQDLVRQVFSAARPTEGHPSVGRVPMADGSQLIFSVSAVKDGETTAKDAKELASSREFLRRAHAQGEYGAFLAELRNQTKVKMKSDK